VPLLRHEVGEGAERLDAGAVEVGRFLQAQDHRVRGVVSLADQLAHPGEQPLGIGWESVKSAAAEILKEGWNRVSSALSSLASTLFRSWW
jgi:hypothetical protein